LGERGRRVRKVPADRHKQATHVEADAEVPRDPASIPGELGGYSRNYVRVLTRGSAGQLNRELEVEASFAKGARLVGEIVEVRETPASPAATTIP